MSRHRHKQSPLTPKSAVKETISLPGLTDRNLHVNMKLVPPPVIPGGNGKEREIGADESRQPRVRQPYSLWTSLRRWVIVAIDQEPPPSQGLRAREAWLRSYVTQEPFLVGVLNSAFDIDKNRGWRLEGAKDQVACYTQMLHTVDDGQGWREFITWMSQSYNLSRVGFVTEFGREGEEGPVRAPRSISRNLRIRCPLGSLQCPPGYTNKNPLIRTLYKGVLCTPL